MKYPKEIKVGPHIFSLSFEKGMSPKHGHLGITKFDSCEIVIEQDQAPSQIQDTIIHEVLHCINNQVKFVSTDEETEEDAVSRIAPLLLAVIRDNPSLLKCVK